MYFGGKTYAPALSAPAEWVCTREAFHRFQYFEWSAGGGGHMRTRPEWESLLGRAMPCTSHLLTVRSVELGSLGSANPGANCVNNSLQSRNSHAKLQTTPRPSEINRHAAGTTSPTCSECDAKSISRLSDTTVRNRCQPSPRAKRTKRKECNQKKSSETRGVPPAATSGTRDREHPL